MEKAWSLDRQEEDGGKDLAILRTSEKSLFQLRETQRNLPQTAELGRKSKRKDRKSLHSLDYITGKGGETGPAY